MMPLPGKTQNDQHSQRMGGLKFSSPLVIIGERMTDQGSFLGRIWAKQYGKQFAITAIASGSSAVVLVACMYQILFLQDHAEWNDFTGGAIIGAVVSLIIVLVSFPEFLRFKGHVWPFLRRLRRFNRRLKSAEEKPKETRLRRLSLIHI